jgi:acyl-CoA synthetase (AMP-forming)/AMP-acid ligase II
LVQPEPAAAFRQRLRAFCRERLASFKIPAKVEIVDSEQFNARYKRVRR